MSEPLRKVSAKKYDQSAKMRWRVKGNDDGPVYAGTMLVKACATCGKASPNDHRPMTTAGDFGGFYQTPQLEKTLINQENDTW